MVWLEDVEKIKIAICGRSDRQRRVPQTGSGKVFGHLNFAAGRSRAKVERIPRKSENGRRRERLGFRLLLLRLYREAMRMFARGLLPLSSGRFPLSDNVAPRKKAM